MDDKNRFDLIVIGGGPGGYVAAIRAAYHGMRVALIEKGHMGGTCLNVGCIPSKTLVASSDIARTVKQAEEFGVECSNIKIHFDKMMTQKDRIVTQMREGLEGLIQSHKVKIFHGLASFNTPHDIHIKGKTSHNLYGNSIIIATGSTVATLSSLPCDHERVFNSDSILDLKRQPQSIAIIGGGYIGCEWASIFANLGTKVTIIEFLPSIIEAQGKTMSQFLTRFFKESGVDIKTGVAVEKVIHADYGVQLDLSDQNHIHADIALVAVGRSPYTENLELTKAGLTTDLKGFIEINEHMQTKVDHIYAIGDVTGVSMLAHVASHQGIVAADHLAGKHTTIDYECVPSVIFTHPEMASVGLTLEQAKERESSRGYKVHVSRFPFSALGKAKASRHPDGLVELITDEQTGEILGCQIIGHDAGNLIAEITLAKRNELTVECIYETIHAHPTMAESIMEAAFGADHAKIHLPPG